MKKYEKSKVVASNRPSGYGSFAAGCHENTTSHWCKTCAVSRNV